MSTAGYLLDTNVLSELMRPAPAESVLAWFTRQPGSTMHTSSIVQAEILTGIALLPAGRRREALARAAQAMFADDLAGRVLPFNGACAEHYALIVAGRTAQGRPISTEDAQIAATALASGMSLVTRNTRDFARIDGLIQLDPWQPR